MNERIRELARQADPDYTGEYDDDMGHALVGDEAIQKFAELIVREVFAKIEDERFEIYQPVKESVMKHFGVKNG